jgi:hypothetical protein
MTVIKTSRSHRMACLILLLVVAVALTTVLVLAAEQSSLATPQNARPARAVATPGAQDVH